MLGLRRLLNDLEVQPIETLRCDDRFDVVLPIEILQISIFRLDFSKILLGDIALQMIQVYVSINPRRRRHRSRSPTSSHRMVLREVGQDHLELVLLDIGHIAPDLYLKFSTFRCPHYKIISASDTASSFPQKSFWKHVDIFIRLQPRHIHDWNAFK